MMARSAHLVLRYTLHVPRTDWFLCCVSARTCRSPAACRTPSNARVCTAAKRCRSSAKNANQWRGAPLDPAEVRRFRARVDETGITPVVSHASYLINLATTDPAAARACRSPPSSTSSIARTRSACSASSFIRARARRAPKTTRSADRRRDSRRVQGAAAAQDDGAARAHGGPGTDARLPLRASRGDHRAPRRLAARRRVPRHVPSRRVRLRHRERRGLSPRRSRRSIGSSASIGCSVFHGNDSKRPCGSRVDRHEHIGDGCLGLEPFRRLLHDPRFDGLPILIETEKSAAVRTPGPRSRSIRSM